MARDSVGKSRRGKVVGCVVGTNMVRGWRDGGFGERSQLGNGKGGGSNRERKKMGLKLLPSKNIERRVLKR